MEGSIKMFNIINLTINCIQYIMNTILNFKKQLKYLILQQFILHL